MSDTEADVQEEPMETNMVTEEVAESEVLADNETAEGASGKEAEPGADEPESEKAEKLNKFPLGRIKNVMKLDPDTNLASQEAVFLISRATELFVESLAAESYSYTANNKKKTIMRHDVDAAIDGVDCLAFLDGALED